MRELCSVFAQRGYIAVTIDYRLLGSNSAATRDAALAVRWIRQNADIYGFDTDRLIIGGNSAGAISSASLAYTTTNFNFNANETENPTQDISLEVAGLLSHSGGGGPSQSAISNGPVVVVISGANNNTFGASLDLAESFATKLENANHPHAFLVEPTGPHVLRYSDYYYQLPAYNQQYPAGLRTIDNHVFEFFYKHLDLAGLLTSDAYTPESAFQKSLEPDSLLTSVAYDSRFNYTLWQSDDLVDWGPASGSSMVGRLGNQLEMDVPTSGGRSFFQWGVSKKDSTEVTISSYDTPDIFYPVKVQDDVLLPATQVGAIYSSVLTAEYGADEPVVWEISSGQLPPGLFLDAATGEIAGIPTQAGTFDFTAKVSKILSADYRSFTIVVSDGPPATTITTERLEAEAAIFSNGSAQSDPRNSGGAFFSGNTNFQVTFNYNAAAAVTHELRFRVSSPSGFNSANVLVNGVQIGTAGTDHTGYTTLVFYHPLPVGANTITFQYGTGTSKLNVDYLQIIESPVSKSTLVLNPAADAYVQGGGNSATNYGNSNELDIQGGTGTGDKRAYLKFDLSSVQGTVTSAILRLKPKATKGKPVLTLYHVDDDTWTESGAGGITYDARPLESTLIDSAKSPIQGGWWLELDVTDLVLNSIGNGDTVLSSVLKSNRDSEDTFHSKEASAASRPQLIITTR